MTTFSNALRETATRTYTENGARARNTSSNALVDLFASIGSLRNRNENEVLRLFADAYQEDKLIATKILFYARDIRGGLGERKVFRDILVYLAETHPEAILPNMDLIGVYGRYDDMYALVGTPVEDAMWKAMKAQWDEDVKNMENGKVVSLLAKWIKTPDATSKNTRELGIKTALKIGPSVYKFKRTLRALRNYLGVIESKMSAGKWDEIKYSAVPSRAMLLYKNAFMRHDESRYSEFINKAVKGEEKINASTLYPYDLIEKYLNTNPKHSPYSFEFKKIKYDASIEAQWKALPDFVGTEANAMVIADVSGSMAGRPICSAVGLAVYFAQRNNGAYHNMWMSFSEDSAIQILKGDTLAQNLANLDTVHWDNNTNLELAFRTILDIALEHNVSNDEMVKSLIVISDMEIDRATYTFSWSFYDAMAKEYAKAGYEIPNVVFWNVNSRHDIFHADANRKGVQLCSGQSASTFKILMGSVGMTPTEMMLKTVNDERYSAITVG